MAFTKIKSINVDGNSSYTFSNTVTAQHIVPSANDTYDLGSPTMVWRNLYVGPGSLYVNGVEVLSDTNNQIVIAASNNQDIAITTTGSGDIEIHPEGTGKILVNGTLEIANTKNITSNDGNPIKFANPVAVDALTSKSLDTDLVISANGSGSVRITDDLVITGNVIFSGTATTVNTEIVTIADNILDLNSNFTTGTPTENAGIRVIRGDDVAVQIRWNETSNQWEFTNDGTTYTAIGAGSGAKGDKGDKGDTGATGSTGLTGDKGDKGEVGATGSAGSTGDKGDKGDTGAAGSTGSKGDKGDTGSAGSTGAKGDKGDIGVTGDKGDKGADSTVAGPTGDKGDKGDIGDKGVPGEYAGKGDKGDKGDLGDKGNLGDKGASADLSTLANTVVLFNDSNYANGINTFTYDKVADLLSANNLTISGLLTTQKSTELISTQTGATGVVTHNVNTATVFYHTSPAANFTANFTNVPTTNSRAFVVAIIVEQGVTPYYPSAVQIDGSAQTIKWVGGAAPTATASQVEVYSFSLLRVSSAWVVLGQKASYA